MNNKIKLTLAALLLSSSLFAGNYNLDIDHSNVSFKVKHMLISNVRGEFTDFTGSFVYDEKTNKLKSLKGIIKVSSIDTDNLKRDKHLKSKDFFHAKKFPLIKYTLNQIKNDKAYGEITIHGITKNIVMDFENNGLIADPWGNTRVGIALEGKISRKDFKLKWNDLLETGGAIVADKIKLYVEIEGILEK